MVSKRPLLLRNSNFFRLWLSQVLSQVGSRMFILALLWWLIVNYSDNQGIALALFLILSTLPSILFVNPIGRIVDSLPLKTILKRADLSGVIISLVLFLSLGNETLFAVSLGVSTLLFAGCQAFIEPSLQKSVNEVVEEKEITSAVAFLSTTQTLAYFAGAVAGAVLIELLGLEGIILLNAATYLASYFIDSSIHFKEVAKDPALDNPTEKEASSFTVLKELPLIRKILFGFTAVNFLSVPTLLLIPLYTKNSLGGDAGLLALNESSIWLGILSGSLLGRYLPERYSALHLTSLLTFLFGLSLSLPGLYIATPLYFVSLFFIGLTVGTMNVRIVSYFQMEVADELKGRFFAVLKALISFMTPFGYLMFGLLSSRVSAPDLSLVQGIGVVFVSVYFFYLSFLHIKGKVKYARSLS